MIDKEVIINALYNRIKAGDMTIDDVPEAYQDEVQALIDIETNDDAGGLENGLLSSV